MPSDPKTRDVSAAIEFGARQDVITYLRSHARDIRIERPQEAGAIRDSYDAAIAAAERAARILDAAPALLALAMAAHRLMVQPNPPDSGAAIDLDCALDVLRKDPKLRALLDLK